MNFSTFSNSRAAAVFWIYWTQGMEMKFWLAFVMLMSLWFVGVVTSNTYNGYIHFLAVFGIVSFAVWLFRRRRDARIQQSEWNR